jgi:hypothetical protein
MVMMDQSRRLAEPLRWTRSGKLAVVAVGLLLAVCILGAGVYGLVHGFGSRKSAPGCIDVTVASTLGGADLHACGHAAKAICASPGAGQAHNDDLRQACRREGYPFGS